MKDELIKVIAEYLEMETIQIDDEFGVPKIAFGGTLNPAGVDHSGFCQEIAAEIAEKLLPIVGEKDLPLSELFDHMANEHGLTLIQGQLGDIIHIARGGGQKTGWEDAPEWAKYKTLDYDHVVTFWETEPIAINGHWQQGGKGGNWEEFKHNPTWKESLQERPK